MKLKKSSHNHANLAKAIALGLAVAGLSVHSTQAQTTWDGGGGTNVLNTNTNWTTDTLPSTSATWDGTPSGNLSLVWEANLGDSVNGMSLNVNAGQTGTLNLDAANGTVALNISNITVASGAGAFSIGNGDATTARTVFRGNGNASGSIHTFTNNSANAVVFQSDVQFDSGGGWARTLEFKGSGDWVFNSGLYAQGVAVFSLNVNGTGANTVTLNAASADAAQNNNINFGTLSLTNGDALGNSGSGTLRIAGSPGTKTLMLSNNIALNAAVANINIGGKAAASDVVTEAAILNQSGNNSIAGKVTFAEAGGGSINILSQAGTLTLNGTVSANVATSTATRNINFAGAGNIIVNGAITDGTDDPVIISKTGNGTTTVTNANTYTAGTSVTAGTFLVNNSTGSGTGTGAVNVTGTATTLGGTGSMDGGVTVGSGSILAPGGAGIESLGAGSLALNDGSTFSFELNTTSPAADLLFASDASAPLTLSGTVTLSLSDLGSGGALAMGTKLTLISYNTSWNNGIFTGLADDSTFTFAGNQWVINYNDTSAGSNFNSDAVAFGTSFVTITVVPEPSTCALIGLACLGGVLATRRRLARY